MRIEFKGCVILSISSQENSSMEVTESGESWGTEAAGNLLFGCCFRVETGGPWELETLEGVVEHEDGWRLEAWPCK